MILPDHHIERFCAEQQMVEPFRPEHLQPASLDVALHDEFRILDAHNEPVIDLDDRKRVADDSTFVKRATFVLYPGEFVLACTEEVVRIPRTVVARIEGKSSVGRVGLAVHVTAGFIDPGFHGRVTLEMVNLNKRPIRLHAGSLVAQLSFQMLAASPRSTYNGRYQDDLGVSPSRYGGGPS